MFTPYTSSIAGIVAVANRSRVESASQLGSSHAIHYSPQLLGKFTFELANLTKWPKQWTAMLGCFDDQVVKHELPLRAAFEGRLQRAEDPGACVPLGHPSRLLPQRQTGCAASVGSF